MMGSPRGRAFVVLLAALAGVALTGRLGVWQLHRAAQKEALGAALISRAALPTLGRADLAHSTADADLQTYRRIHLHGRWLAARTVFLDNRQMDDRTGFYVVTPLLLDDAGDAVLVQRGWAPRNMQDRTALPPVTTPSDAVDVEGLIAPPPGRLYEFAHETGGTIRQNLDVAGFSRESGLNLRPLSVQQTDSPADPSEGLLRHWPQPALDVQHHYGYAFQWFAMAALMAGLYVWFQLIRPRLRRKV
jgi:surfeit locus 1 family protein